MSTTRYARDGLAITTYAGPAGANVYTGGRVHVQITSHGQHVGLSMDHWVDLVCFIRRLDEQGIGVTSAPEIPD
jgi:hypothetical protein